MDQVKEYVKERVLTRDAPRHFPFKPLFPLTRAILESKLLVFLLKDKLRHIKIFKSFLIIHQFKLGSAKPKVIRVFHL